MSDRWSSWALGAIGALLVASAPRIAAAQDADGDGYAVEDGDCDDADPEVHPHAIERCGNGVDDNCNAIVDETHTWYLDGYFQVGGEWVSMHMGLPFDSYVAPTADQLRQPIGFLERGSGFHIDARPADCAAAVVFDWMGTAASCASPSGEIDCGGHDTGPFVIEATVLDTSGASMDSSMLVLQGMDVVPERLSVAGLDMEVGEEGCWSPFFDTGEEITFTFVEAPGEPSLGLGEFGNVVACWTPRASDRGEHPLVVRAEDGEGNVLETTRTVFVSGCASVGHGGASAGWLLALMLLARRPR